MGPAPIDGAADQRARHRQRVRVLPQFVLQEVPQGVSVVRIDLEGPPVEIPSLVLVNLLPRSRQRTDGVYVPELWPAGDLQVPLSQGVLLGFRGVLLAEGNAQLPEDGLRSALHVGGVHERSENPLRPGPITGNMGELGQAHSRDRVPGVELQDDLQVLHLRLQLGLGQISAVIGGISAQLPLDAGKGLIRFLQGGGHAGQLPFPGRGKPEGTLVRDIVSEVRIGVLHHRPDLDLGRLGENFLGDLHIEPGNAPGSELHDVMHRPVAELRRPQALAAIGAVLPVDLEPVLHKGAHGFDFGPGPADHPGTAKVCELVEGVVGSMPFAPRLFGEAGDGLGPTLDNGQRRQVACPPLQEAFQDLGISLIVGEFRRVGGDLGSQPCTVPVMHDSSPGIPEPFWPLGPLPRAAVNLKDTGLPEKRTVLSPGAPGCPTVGPQ